MLHELKCIPPYFGQIVEGRKTFELRENDRDYKINDYLKLREYIPSRKAYTGAERLVKVIGILQEFQGIEEGYCILSIELIRSACEIILGKKQGWGGK